MILPLNASLVVSAARHLVKLGQRLDHIAAEKAAVTGPLVLTLPKVATPDLTRCAEIIERELQRTAGVSPDIFAADRAQLTTDVDLVLRQQQQPSPGFGQRFEKYFPDYQFFHDPDAAALVKLRAAFPGVDWKDPAARIAFFAIDAGGTPAQIGYAGRMALSVVDTLLEFGSENAATLVNDPKLSGIAETVLQRFAEPEWGSFTRWNPVVQTALKSVLGAALDVAGKHPANNPWLQGALDALIDARDAAVKDQRNGDDFLLGLLRGEGFRELLSHGLLIAGDRFAPAEADGFRRVAADLLKMSAPLVLDPGHPGFRAFFNAHWGDLLRAGLSSIDRHGDTLLAGQDPLLASVLRKVVVELKDTPDAEFFTSDMLHGVADVTIGGVLEHLATEPDVAKHAWLGEFIHAAAATVRQFTARNLLSREAAEALWRDALAALAQHPHLLIAHPGLPQEIAGSVLGTLATLPRGEARQLGEATLRAAFGAIARDPALAGKPFGSAVQAVANTLAESVASDGINAHEAATLASVSIDALLRNPALFSGLQNEVAAIALRAVQAAVPGTAHRAWARRLLIPLARAVLQSLARSGAARIKQQTAAQIEAWLTQALGGGLQLAAQRLGHNVDLDGIPAVVSALLDRALRGESLKFDPQDAAFQQAFDQLAATLLPPRTALPSS